MFWQQNADGNEPTDQKATMPHIFAKQILSKRNLLSVLQQVKKNVISIITVASAGKNDRCR